MAKVECRASVNGTSEDTNDHFLEDPALFYDELPQPYRRINKILVEIFDDAWEEISKWEAARIEKASRIRPPIYDCASPLQSCSGVRCITASHDGQYIIVGLSDGVVVVSALSQQVEAFWKEDGMEIIQADVKPMSDNTFLINTRDKLGVVRLFAYSKFILFLFHTVNEGEDSLQRIVVKSDVSDAGDFIAICFKERSSSQHWLEVHKLPKDAWLKEAETVVGKINADKPIGSKCDMGEAADVEMARTEMSTSNDVGEAVSEPMEGTAELHRLLSSVYQKVLATQKFSLSVLVFKLPQPNKAPGMLWRTPYQATKAAGSDGDVFGTGINHLISAHHLDSRTSAFKSQHQHLLPYLPKDYGASVTINSVPTFHFLFPSKLSSHDMTSARQPTTLAVWWSGERHLMHYSLTKQSKGDLKPESVWSVSSPIVCSAVSECSCTLALGLANNSIVIWNRNLGLAHNTLLLDDPGQISQLMFAASVSSTYEPVVVGRANNESPNSLIAQCSSGSLYTVLYASGRKPSAVLVSTDVLTDGEIPATVEPIQGIPQLVLVRRQDGRIFLHDIVKKEALCEVALPLGYMHSDSDTGLPTVVTAAGGKVLYAIGGGEMTGEGNDDEGDIPVMRSLFVVKMWLFPHLDVYLMKSQELQQPTCPCKVSQNNNLELQISKILQNRIDDQADRKVRLSTRWYQMKEDLAQMLRLKTANLTKA